MGDLTPVRQLSGEEKRANKDISTRRGIVEHVIAVIKNHAVLNGRYRGSFATLQVAYKVIVHYDCVPSAIAPPQAAGAVPSECVHSGRRRFRTPTSALKMVPVMKNMSLTRMATLAPAAAAAAAATAAAGAGAAVTAAATAGAGAAAGRRRGGGWAISGSARAADLAPPATLYRR